MDKKLKFDVPTTLGMAPDEDAPEAPEIPIIPLEPTSAPQPIVVNPGPNLPPAPPIRINPGPPRWEVPLPPPAINPGPYAPQPGLEPLRAPDEDESSEEE